MLNDKHLELKSIKKSELTGEIRVKSLSEHKISYPEDSEELFEFIKLCSDVADYSHLILPRLLEEFSADESNEQKRYEISIARRNIIQGHTLKDTLLKISYSKQLVDLKGYVKKGNLVFCIYSCDGRDYIVRANKAFIANNPADDLDELPAVDVEGLMTKFSNVEEYISASKRVRVKFIAWDRSHKRYKEKVKKHNIIYAELMRRKKSGELEVVED